MDSLMLIVLNEPSGMWETILGAFKSAMGSYILAVILLAVIVRILFSVVDIFNKRINMKNMQINEKMKPELEAVQKKYGHDKVLLQKKQSEIYKKYQYSMVGTCLPMLLVMVLQMVVFLTLWTGLQNVSNYNIVKSYENTKTVYYNVLMLNEDEQFTTYLTDKIASGENYTIDVDINVDNKTMNIYVFDANNEQDFVKENIVITDTLTNEEIYNLITSYAVEEEPENPETPPESETTLVEGNSLTDVNKAIKTLAEEVTADYYIDNMESFLWIKNIYKAESPMTSPVFTKEEITNYLNSYYTDEEKAIEEEHHYEEQIFDYVIVGLNERDLGVNGYFILVILAVVSSFLSIFLSNKLMKGNQAAGGGKLMYFIMPLILGIFTLMYTSLFAIYIIVGQLVMIAMAPLNNLIVKKWVAASAKKQEQKKKDIIDVDYRRKD